MITCLDSGLLLANVHLQENEMDEMGLLLANSVKIRGCFAHIFTGTCLYHNSPE